MWTLGKIRSVLSHFIISLNFAGRISMYGPLNLKVVPFPRTHLKPQEYFNFALRLDHKSTGKYSVHNLQYRPQTRLVRGVYVTGQN